MLQHGYLLAKIGADTAENEQHFAEILPKIGNDAPTRCGTAVAVPQRGAEDGDVEGQPRGGDDFRAAVRAVDLPIGSPASCSFFFRAHRTNDLTKKLKKVGLFECDELENTV